MTIASLSEQLGLKLPQEHLQESFLPEHLDALQASSAKLATAVREDTVTIEDIDTFFKEYPDISPALKDRLLSKKAWLLSTIGRLEEALECYGEALKHDEAIPSTWTLKGTALLQLERLDEAFDAFQKAYLHRHKFGPQKPEHLENLLGVWSTSALLRGLYGILEQNITEAQKGVEEYISILNQAKDEGLQTAVLKLAVEEPVEQDLRDALEELDLMVRLLSIRDPFARWRELGRELSKVWPDGVSAVDAIREQRDREWNT